MGCQIIEQPANSLPSFQVRIRRNTNKEHVQENALIYMWQRRVFH